MDHAAFPELIAGRAVDDLTTDEQLVLDAHLSGCGSCQALGAELEDVAAELAFAAQPRRLPDGLGSSISAAIAAAHGRAPTAVMGRAFRPAVAAPFAFAAADAPGSAWPARVRAHLPAPGRAFVVAALAVILLAGGYAMRLGDRLDQAQRTADTALAELASRDAALAVVADPAHLSAELDGRHSGDTGRATLVYLPGSSSTYMLVAGLPATAPGSVYQFWYADASGVHPGPTFGYPGSGTALMPLNVDLAGSQAAMLTLEPAAGQPTQPSTDVIFGELPQS